MYERNRISLDGQVLTTCYAKWTLPVKANVAATNLEIKIGLNGDERIEISTAQKNLILWTGTSERSNNQSMS